MKAIVQNRYGSSDVLELREVDDPVARDDQLLVRVRAASVHADVWHVMRGVPYVLRIMGAGVRRPKNLVPGTDLAGQVESVGRNVTQFRPGDEVFGQSLVANLWRHGGAFAEYAAVPEARFELKRPASRSNRPPPSPRPDRSRCRVFAMRAGSWRARRS
jgi:NADPH:quinone reductase-like Zn-dependent oxidoreductase